MHLGWLLLVYAGILAVVAGTGGYSPVTRWVFTAVSLTVVMLFINNLVARRDRADTRARHFFDLSQDMLCTMDEQGRCIEVNAAWERNLGFRPAEMRGKRLLDFTHPDDHARATEEAVRRLLRWCLRRASRRGSRPRTASGTGCGPVRCSSPKRGSSTPAPPTSPCAKRWRREREELIAEVQTLARSDALTGLPNRRALDDQLPREMARALRAESPLCLAIIDIDNFKVYNDTHGHLAGDAVLRDCATAWDAELRGVDTILRFGGEEFLVVLPELRTRGRGRDHRAPARRHPRRPDLLGRAGAVAAGGERRRPRRPRRQSPL